MPPDLLEAVEAIRQALDLGSNVAAFVSQNARLVLDVLYLFVFQTVNPLAPPAPFTTVRPIQEFTPLVQLAANSGLTATVIWGSYRVMWGRVSYRTPYTPRVLLPRLVLAVLLINFALPLVQGAVDASNALCDSIALATQRQVLRDLTEFTGGIGFVGLEGLVQIVLFASYLVLAFAYVIRFALLVVLSILAPAAALLFVLPETHHYAREWSTLFVSALLMQPLQLLILAIGFALDSYSVLPVRHLFALGAVWLAFKVPGALRSASQAGTRAAGLTRTQIRHAVRLAAKS